MSTARFIYNQLENVRNDADLKNISDEAKRLAKALRIELDNVSKIVELRTAIDTEIVYILKDENVTVERFIESIKADEKEENKDETKLESKVPERELLKQLLEEYDEAMAKKAAGENEEDIVRKLGGDKKYQQIRDQLRKAIEKKKEIEAKLRAEEKIKEIFPEETREKIINELANEELVAESEGVQLSERSKEILEEYVIENHEKLSNKEDVKKEEAELEKELKKERVPVEKIREILAETKETAVKIEIVKIVGVESEKIVSSLAENNPEVATRKEEIRILVRERVRGVLAGERFSATEAKAEGEGSNQRAVTFEDEVKAISGASSLHNIDRTVFEGVDSRLNKIKDEKPDLISEFRSLETIKEVWKSLTLIEGTDEEAAMEMAKFTAESIHGKEAYRVEGWKDVDGDKGADGARIITNALRSPESLESNLKKYNAIKARLGITLENQPKIAKQLKAVDQFYETIKKNPAVAHLMEASRRWVALQEKFSGFTTKIISGVATKIATKIGIDTSSVFMTTVAEISRAGITKEVLTGVATSVLGQTTVLALKTSAEALATKVAGTAAGKAAVWLGTRLGLASTGIGAPVVLVAMAADLAFKAVKKIVNTIGSALRNIATTVFGEQIADSLSSIVIGAKRFLVNTGKALGSIAVGALSIAGGLIALPTLLPIIPTILIVIIVVALVGGILFVSNTTSMEMSTLVPPPMEAGNCVMISPSGTPGAGSGEINCNQNLEEKNVPGVDRNNFFRVADAWHGGKNFSRECFNDVVCRARSAGVDETFALWVWLHESGASNYFRNDIEDFGIHGQSAAPPMNFNAQIDYFVKLGLGNPCTNLDFWLGWATGYQTGQFGTCNPDQPVDAAHPQNTGRNYLAAIQSQWSIISNNSMPGQIRKPGTGESCGNSADYSDDNTTYTYVDENGDTWLCKNLPGIPEAGGPIVIPDFPPWDPDTPVPEGCPDRLPVSGGHFSQGPFAPSCSHQSMTSPAIDIGIGAGAPIMATHPGVVSYGADSVYGFYIDLHGTCEGKAFTTRYAHMPQGGYTAANGAEVSAGARIGTVDNTGSSTGNHIHYHITGLETNRFGQYLGLSAATTAQLWGCCGSWNGKYCP